jgi:hypothetical protein
VSSGKIYPYFVEISMAALVKKEAIDWKSYEAKAVMRGKLMLCISPEIARSWYVAYDKHSKRPSGPLANESLYFGSFCHF